MDERMRKPGGTSGGCGSFLLGLIMAAAGGYLILDMVQVTSGGIAFFGFMGIGGTTSFGLALVPLILGIGLLFFDAKSVVGWLVTIAGIAIVFAAILANIHIFIRPTSLFSFIVMLVLLVGGLGLMFRGLFRGK